MYCSIVSAIVPATSSSEYSWSESKLKSGDLNSSRLSVLKCLLDDRNSRSGSGVGVDTTYLMYWIRRIRVSWSRDHARIRRIFLDGYGVLEFLGVGTTHKYSVSSLMDTAYWLVTFSEHDSEITKDGKVIGHANMRLIQSLASKELVRNLLNLKFDQHFCDAFKIGKQAHASHKAKNIVLMTRCLELLHMNLFSPSAVRSYGGNRYTLVIVDDYSREHGRMILESVEHGPLIWPTIEENGMTRIKKYEELSATKKIQANCDLTATNIILQGLPFDVYSLVNTKFLNSLPPEWSKFVTDVKLVRDLHTTNFDQLHAYLEQHELHANEVRIIRELNQDPLALVVNHQMTPSHFNTYQSSYNNPQFQQQFSPSQSPQYGSFHSIQHYSTTYPSIPSAITYLSTTHPNAYSSIVHQDALVVPVFKQGDDPIDAINKMMSFMSIVVTSRFPTTNNQLRNSSNPRQQETIHDGRNNSGQLRIVSFNCQGEGHMARQYPKTKRKTDATWFRDKVLLVEAQGSGKVLNEEELEFLADPRVAEVLIANLSSNESDVLSKYLLETQNVAVQDTNSSAQQDAMILSVFEQLSNKVTNCNKVNKENLIANESLYAELKRYNERLNFIDERQNVDLSTREKLIMDDIIQEKNAQPMLYDGSVITKETNVISIADSKETLMLEEESRSKMILKQSDPMVLEMKFNIKPINYDELNRLSKDFGKCFVPQQELSDEQAFRLQTSHPNTGQSASLPVKIEAPRELPKEQLLEPALNLTVRCCGREFRVLNGYDQKSFDEERGLNCVVQSSLP
ncbi:hypothetical protein Tco_1407400 [Tanacetum coccineum]